MSLSHVLFVLALATLAVSLLLFHKHYRLNVHFRFSLQISFIWLMSPPHLPLTRMDLCSRTGRYKGVASNVLNVCQQSAYLIYFLLFIFFYRKHAQGIECEPGPKKENIILLDVGTKCEIVLINICEVAKSLFLK